MVKATIHQTGEETVAIMIKGDRWEALGEAHRVAMCAAMRLKIESDVRSWDEKSSTLAIFFRFPRTSELRRCKQYLEALASEVM